jgi:hypothetical protein
VSDGFDPASASAGSSWVTPDFEVIDASEPASIFDLGLDADPQSDDGALPDEMS